MVGIKAKGRPQEREKLSTHSHCHQRMAVITTKNCLVCNTNSANKQTHHPSSNCHPPLWMVLRRPTRSLSSLLMIAPPDPHRLPGRGGPLISVRIQKSDQTGDWTQAFWTYTRCSNRWAIQPCWVQSYNELLCICHPKSWLLVILKGLSSPQ